MKTRCPNCQTVFRITSEQLTARAGRVRCGHCRKVFNALDSLLEDHKEIKERHPDPAPASLPADTADTRAEPVSTVVSAHADVRVPPKVSRTLRQTPLSSPVHEPKMREVEESEWPPADEMPYFSAGAPSIEIQSIETQARVKAVGLIIPRDTTEIPGYSKWDEGVMAPPIVISSENPVRWPFRLAAAGLALALAGQALFHFRGELAVSTPSLRPALEKFSLVLGAALPLPRHTEQVSIETSDLQIDPARGNLLVMNATLRNKAPYGQAYPSLEFSLTDTQDTVIARRVFAPQDYLPAKTAANPVFSGNSDVAVRLWIEAVDLAAAGYRLFVFYP
jgi:predicted Zn finger-like uncharacterized protein